MQQPLADWTRRVDALCREHLACDWQDPSGDHEPLESGYEAGQTPMEFVRCIDDVDSCRHGRPPAPPLNPRPVRYG